MASAVPDDHVVPAVTALKRILLSQWRHDAMDALMLSESTRAELNDIARDIDESIAETEAAFRDWTSGEMVDPDDLATFEGEVLYTAVQGYLESLTAALDSSAVFFQKAALLAPEGLSERFAQLGGRDFEHSMRMRRLLVDLFYSSTPFPEMAQGERAPPGR